MFALPFRESENGVKLWGRVPWDVTMAYEHQKAIQRELDARIPRGLRGSKQNEFRFGVYFYLIQRHSFNASVTLARAMVRKMEPNFEPRVLLIGLTEADRAFLRDCGISLTE